MIILWIKKIQTQFIYCLVKKVSFIVMMVDNPTPWLADVMQAIPPLKVSPCLRHIVIHDFGTRGRKNGIELEARIYSASGGDVMLYRNFVQSTNANEEEALQAADCMQLHVGSINNRRDDLLQRIRSAHFKCEEVPEASDSDKQCPRCGGRDLGASGRQTRSADEGQTIFYFCRSCDGPEFR
jgi:DNA-directed RNA polymerase subunit M/transcription elongation factor TFIIS